MTLAGKKILVGITGGIAAYKTPMLVRLLVQNGAEVEVVLTDAAREFVTPATLTALTGKPPRSELFDLEAEAAMGHIELARWADAVLIAPATANSLARLAGGLADDLLSTVVLASTAPLYVAPAMNQAMWLAPATQENVAKLTARGVQMLGPDSGDQACGDVGPGRMMEPEAIVKALDDRPVRMPLNGKNMVITAGPTREAIDPVRYISNHSSGKQGYALASAALSAGAQVTLISGPTALPAPTGAKMVYVESAQQMHDASLAEIGHADIFVGVAAVADYRPATVYEQKIKREKTGDMNLDMVANPDIIRAVAAAPDRPRLVVGFAAETNDAIEHARAKLKRKGIDAIIVNDVSNPEIGFNSDENAAVIITHGFERPLAQQSKESLSTELIEVIAELLQVS